MRRSDPSPHRRSRRSFALLAVLAPLLGLAAPGPAGGQEGEEAPRTGDELFGSYSLEARGQGVQALYNLVDFLPGGSPVIDLSLPETLTRFSSGPTGYGLASLAYPGGILTNLSSLLDQSGADGSQVPPYPILAEVFYPSGESSAGEAQPGGVVQRVEAGDLGVQANAAFPAIEAAPLIEVGTIRSASRTSIEDGQAVSRTRVDLGDIRILGGIITIQGLVTDIVATHNGVTGATAGGTTASGVRFLGLAASLTEEGLVLGEAPPLSDSPAGPLDDLLADLAAPLEELTAPVRDLVTQVLAQAVPQLNDLLAAAGIELRLLDPQEVIVDGGAATRTTTGLSLTFTYEGREQDGLRQLIASIPEDLKPALGPIPNPLTFLVENHVMGVSLATATVSSLATEPFPAIEFEPPPIDGGPTPPPTTPVDLGDPGFAAPLPDLGGSPVGRGPGGGSRVGGEPISNFLAAGIPAALVILALLAAPLLGVGSTRLADNVLAPVSRSCPNGLDKPPAPPRPS